MFRKGCWHEWLSSLLSVLGTNFAIFNHVLNFTAETRLPNRGLCTFSALAYSLVPFVYQKLQLHSWQQYSSSWLHEYPMYYNELSSGWPIRLQYVIKTKFGGSASLASLISISFTSETGKESKTLAVNIDVHFFFRNGGHSVCVFWLHSCQCICYIHFFSSYMVHLF